MAPQQGGLSPTCDNQAFANKPEDHVLAFIDGTLDNITGELMHPGGKPSITLKRRSNQATHFLNWFTGALEHEGTNMVSTYSWPGKNKQEAWYFAIILRVLEHLSEAVRDDFVTSKRLFCCLYRVTFPDIYYMDPTCFRSQKVVDILVDDIAYTIGVDRRALHVAAAAKGLVAGCCQILLKNQTLIDVEFLPEGTLIPRIEDIESISFPGINWILVIEKEAVFRRLASKSYDKSSALGKGVLLTGKGYPDLCTRGYLRMLSEGRPESPASSGSPSFSQAPPIFALVDSDPDGMAIMSIFKYGSAAQAHENAKLNVRELRWVGLRTSSVVDGSDTAGEESFLPLTPRGRKKAVAMLSSPSFSEDGPEPTWRAELQQMLILNLKAEIEILYERDGGLEGWLDKKMQETI